ncbi:MULTISPECIES: GTP cyclohydrolase I [Pseudanabaena]|uniref:GTP cyclohydrolase I n=1 Tax=Pseudanabaena TaxID=1152 RepID=UPI00247A90BA|nr:MULTISPECIES: GTP cyclohydrolase I [Pseudanabaena]MEA5488009.1 GTP cyclohydrolase I [Pseudanabaena sp. CCNP1317]WGS71815.1 GTP cyclohydrolase I [Pseudanabaena galeata CCNP1313]
MTISISRPVNSTSENDSKAAKVLESLPTRKAISQVIRDRVIAAGDPFFANDSISHHISEIEREELKKEIEGKLQGVFDSLIIDTANDHNTKETARRVAKMYVDEVFKGRYHPMPKVTDFPNAKELDEIYTLGPITVRSACSHHFVPIVGQAWIGIVPSDRVIGISKFNRIVDWVMSRPHIQEEAAIMVADTIENLIKPKGLAFVIKAQHMCMTWRGVKEPETKMVNSIVRGSFRSDPSMKKEFFDLIRAHGFGDS